MSHLRPVRLILIMLAALAGGCPDDGSTGAQTTGVVQETNMPCDQTTCVCDAQYFYMQQVTRECDGMPARLSICSALPVCDAVIEMIAAQVTTCSEPASPFPIDLEACNVW